MAALGVLLSIGCSKSIGAYEVTQGLTLLNAVWQRIDESYYDPDFGGKDWKGIGERFREEMETTSSMGEARGLVRRMIAELGESHFALIATDFELFKESRVWQQTTWGGQFFLQDGEVFLWKIVPGGPAALAGLRAGDRLLEVGGASIEDLWQEVRESGALQYLQGITFANALERKFLGRVGDGLSLKVKSPDGEEKVVTLQLRAYLGKISPQLGNMGAMPISLEAELGDDGIGYLSFDLWMPAIMGEMRAFVSSLEDSGAKGLIVDLRGNPGGIALMAGGLAGLLVHEQTLLGTAYLREGKINYVGYPQKTVFSGPVAVLVDGMSCSTSEIFALGMQESGRVRVFGSSSPGAALPSAFHSLPNGDLLQLVVADLKTEKGTRLEGRGVLPDVAVALSPIDLAKGTDTVFEAAKSWLLSHQKNPIE